MSAFCTWKPPTSGSFSGIFAAGLREVGLAAALATDLLGDEARLKRLGTRGRERIANRFGAPIAGARLTKVYDAILGGGQPVMDAMKTRVTWAKSGLGAHACAMFLDDRPPTQQLRAWFRELVATP